MKSFGAVHQKLTGKVWVAPEWIRTELCDCGESVEVFSIELPFGPNKGQKKEVKKGCTCEELQLIQAMRAYKKQGELHRLERLFQQESLVNADLQRATFDNYDPPTESLRKVHQEVMNYAESFRVDEPLTLLFAGSYGVGKSHLAYAYADYLLQQHWSTLFLSVPKLLTKIKATYRSSSEVSENEVLESIARVDVLVLDDIGAEYQSKSAGDSWAQSKLFELIDSRVGKHNVYTTNLTGEGLRQQLGNRNFSRLMQRAVYFQMEGPDFRLKAFEKGGVVR